MMNDHVEKLCEELRAELVAVNKQIHALKASQAESKACLFPSKGRRLGKNILLIMTPLLGLLAAGGLLHGQGPGEALFIDTLGKVGIGTNAPKAPLDVQQEPRTDLKNHPESVKVLYATGGLGENSGIEFRHSNGSQGIGFGYNTIYATGSNSNQDLNLEARGTGKIKVKGVLEGIGAVPKGAVLMWSGDPAQIPTGWALCDGTSGTPDLRSRFIVGYDPRVADYNTVKKVGGLEKVALGQAEMGNHTHAVNRGGNAVGTHDHHWAGSPTTDANANVALYGPSTAGATQIDAAVPHENRPPYMVLAFIMYMGEARK
jgi:microcystin-dependent protein